MRGRVPRPWLADRSGRQRIAMARGAAAIAVLVGLLALAGCGGDDSADSGASGASGGGDSSAQSDTAGVAEAVAAPAGEAAAGGTAPASAAQLTAAAARRVRTAEVTVEVGDQRSSTARVRAVAAALGGIVASETSGYDRPASQSGGPAEGDGEATGSSSAAGESVIVLRVPEPKLEDALARIAAIGRELTRTTSSEDVTAPLVDLASRVATQQKSVERVRALLGRAGSLQDVVLLEAELSKREAELEAVQARQRSLSDRADLATVTAVLRTPGVQDTSDDASFLTGFRQGWQAVLTSTTVVLTVLGALLPIAIVLGIVGVPAYLLLRRYRRSRPAPQQPPSTFPPAAAPSPTPAPTSAP